MKLSILTATYNRANLIIRLYESILKNLNSGIDVEWLIMDDGSNDETEAVISKIRDDNYIYIKYLKQVNQGKMAAINHLMEYVRGDLIVECDSDDYFTDDAFFYIKNAYEEAKYEKDLYGLCFLKHDQNGHNIGNNFITEKTTMFDLYFKDLEDGEKAIVFFADRRKDYSYELEGNEKFVTCEELTIEHYPDNNKSRSNYLPLLELAVKEEPNNDRNTHYLGREYMFHQRWNESIDMLIKHLSLPTATWKDERCASMRFIARCYKNLNRFEEAKMWLNKAINEAPYLRDPYVEFALLYYQLNDWHNVIKYCNEALKIEKHAKSYINETFSWDYTIYDLLAIAYYNLNNYQKSLENINIALKMNPNDERLKNNKILIEKKAH